MAFTPLGDAKDIVVAKITHVDIARSTGSLLDRVSDMMSNMTVTERYKSDLAEAIGELNNLMLGREELEARIARLKKKVAALRELVEASEDARPSERLVDGVTDACRTVLRAAKRPLLPIEVRDEVQRLGLPEQSNLLASVYTVLRRLKQTGEVAEDFTTHRNPGGSAVAAYMWAGPVQRLGYPNPTNTRKK